MARPRRNRKISALAWPLGAALMGAVSLYFGLVQGGVAKVVSPAETGDDSVVTVNIPVASRPYIDSWPKFLACYGFTADLDPIKATLRENNASTQPFSPNRAIRVVVRPTGSLGPALKGEEAVIQAAKALSADRDGATACPR